MSDIVTRLLLKTNDFDANLEKSKKNVNGFQGGISNMAKTAGASIMKFAGTIGLAMGAYGAFDKLMHSSQGTQDALEWRLSACKETVDAFFHSLSSGDFTAFNDGIVETYDNMIKLQQLRDDFADAKISNNVFRAQYSFESQRLKAIISDNSSTKKEKQAAATELKKMTEAYSKQLSSTNDINVAQMIQNAQAKTGRYYAKEDIIRFFKVYNNPASFDDRKGAFDSYVSKMDSLNKKKYEYKTVNTSAGAMTQRVVNPEVQKQITQLQKENNELDRMYILSQHNDKTWEGLSSSVIEYYQSQEEAARNLNFLVKQNNKAGNNGTGDEIEAKEGSIAWYDAEISKLNKKLVAETDKQAKSTIQATINELEAKKIKLQVEASGNSIEAINIQLSALNKQLITETDMQARATIQATINELEQKKINLKFVVDQEAFKIKNGEMKDGALSVPIAPTYDKVPTHGNGGKNFKLSKFESPIKKKDIDVNEEYAKSLYAVGSIMSSLSGITNESTAAYLQWGAGVVSSIAQAIPAIRDLITAKQTEAVVNGVTSATETPVVGWLLAGAAVASVIAAMASIPKFATGGIVPGVSFTGDKVPALLNSGEMILNGSQQSNLFQMLNSGLYGSLSQKIAPSAGNGNQPANVTFRIHGRDLEGVLSNHYNQKSKVR